MTVLAWIGGTELMVALVVGLLLFGGRLPDVMKDVGRVFFKLRRSLDDIRRETGLDETLRELERESRKVRTSIEEDTPEWKPAKSLEWDPATGSFEPDEPEDGAGSHEEPPANEADEPPKN